MLEILLLIVVIVILAGAFGGPRVGWFPAWGLVNVVLLILGVLLVIWLISALVGSGFDAGVS